MRDIIKSGTLLVTLFALLAIAAATSDGESSNANYNIGEKASLVDDDYAAKEDKLTNKEDIHIPL